MNNINKACLLVICTNTLLWYVCNKYLFRDPKEENKEGEGLNYIKRYCICGKTLQKFAMVNSVLEIILLY